MASNLFRRITAARISQQEILESSGEILDDDTPESSPSKKPTTVTLEDSFRVARNSGQIIPDSDEESEDEQNVISEDDERKDYLTDDSDDDVPLVKRNNMNKALISSDEEDFLSPNSSLTENTPASPPVVADRIKQSRGRHDDSLDSPMVRSSVQRTCEDSLDTPVIGVRHRVDQEMSPVKSPVLKINKSIEYSLAKSSSSEDEDSPVKSGSNVEEFDSCDDEDVIKSPVRPRPTLNEVSITPPPSSPDSPPKPNLDRYVNPSKLPSAPKDQVIDVKDSDSDSDSSVEVVTPPKSSDKTYTQSDLRELEGNVRRLTSGLAQSEALLSARGRSLPDGGAALRQSIERDKSSLKQQRELLVKARTSVTGAIAKLQPGLIKPINNMPSMVKPINNMHGFVKPINNNPAEFKLEEAKKRRNQLQKALELAAKLPDGGEQLRSKLANCESEIKALSSQVLPSGVKLHNSAWDQHKAQFHEMDRDELLKAMADGPASNQLYGGRMTAGRVREVKTVTVEALTKIKESLDTMPAEGDMEEQPLGLRASITLFPHQRQGLSWLLWRETQHPRGGILADDMGLGKTLTMISLILKHKEVQELSSGDDKENEWSGEKLGHLVKSNTTLIICPASLIGQWEKEVENKVKSGRLKVLVYHGNKRSCSARTLARYDMVITTYGTVQSEVKSVLGDKAEKEGKKKMEDLKGAEDLETTEKSSSELLNIAWERVILDEAHIIRNPRSLTSQAVCKMRSGRRWCVTGTPIQNKELDLYSLIRFLRCSPFDEYQLWKRWVGGDNAQAQERMNTLVRSLLLRRTKDQKSNVTGQVLVDLPARHTKEHKICLKSDEKKVYDKVFSFSQNAMERYMEKAEEKKEMAELGFGGGGAAGAVKETNKPDYTFRPGEGPLAQQGEVKAHHLLVLLLRLRQICCHPGLIKGMLDHEEKVSEGIEDKDGEEMDLISAMEDLDVSQAGGEEEADENIFHIDNPIFNVEKESSKINRVVRELGILRRKKIEEGIVEKAVIVSQWKGMLDIVKVHMKELGIKCAEINGQVNVKHRGEIVDDFNKNERGAQVMLLSLGAGGVGLNLVGANHLFLLDMHWNPQMEAQAKDRIYRVGQKKEVYIHRFIMEGTVEEKILKLQEKKLNMADDVLSGAKRKPTKLTMEDLKELFS